jgi:hypothetical protein
VVSLQSGHPYDWSCAWALRLLAGAWETPYCAIVESSQPMTGTMIAQCALLIAIFWPVSTSIAYRLSVKMYRMHDNCDFAKRRYFESGDQ